MNNEDLIQLAKDVQAGKVFTDRHLQRPEDLPMIFMPIALGALDKEPLKTAVAKKDVGHNCLEENCNGWCYQ